MEVTERIQKLNRPKNLAKLSLGGTDDHPMDPEEFEAIGDLALACARNRMDQRSRQTAGVDDELHCLRKSHLPFCFCWRHHWEIACWVLQYSSATSSGILCIFDDHTCAPRSWMCKKQTAASDSNAAADVISLDTEVRTEDLPALSLWDSEEHTDFLFHAEKNASAPPNHPKCDVRLGGLKGGIEVPTTFAPTSDKALIKRVPPRSLLFHLQLFTGSRAFR